MQSFTAIAKDILATLTVIQKFIAEIFPTHKNTLSLTETRKRKGVELVILLSY